MPTAILLASPNGAGKTTFASQHLADGARGFVFVNPDEIARELAATVPVGERDMLAGRIVLQRLDTLVESRADFVVETTLSNRLYARRIPAWRQAGYRVGLIYLKSPSAEASVARVAGRVSRGGHGIPEDDLRRRYGRSLSNLETVYKPIIDTSRVWAGRDGRFELLESSHDR